MRKRMIYLYLFGFAFGCIVALLCGSFFSEPVTAQSSTRTPTPTRTPTRIQNNSGGSTLRNPDAGTIFSGAKVAPIVTPEDDGSIGPGPKPIMPADLMKIWQILPQKRDIGVFRIASEDNTWSTEFDRQFLPNAPVTLYAIRTLDALGMVDVQDSGIIVADDTGSVTIPGHIPALAPGGKYVGIASTLEDSSLENVLAHIDSPLVAVWEFELPSLIDVKPETMPDTFQPNIEFNYNLAPGLSMESVSVQWFKDGEPLPSTDNPLYSFGRPFEATTANSIQLYQPGAYWYNWANSLFGTQFYVPPADEGVYRADVSIEGVYEKSIEIPVGQSP